MKHARLYLLLMVMASATIAAYTQVTIDAARLESPIAILVGVAVVALALPLLKKVRNRYTRSAWPVTMCALIAGTVTFGNGLRVHAIDDSSDFIALLLRTLNWLSAAGYAWISSGLIISGLWLTAALFMWWFRRDSINYAEFPDLVREYANAYAPRYILFGIMVALGAMGGLMIGLAVGSFIGWVAPDWRDIAPQSYIIRMCCGAAFGAIAGILQVRRAHTLLLVAREKQRLKRNPDAAQKPARRQSRAAARFPSNSRRARS